MPRAASSARISSSASIVRSSEGKRRTAIAAPKVWRAETWGPDSRARPLSSRMTEELPSLHLEEEFECLQVTTSFGHRFTPSIKPVAAQQNSVCIGIIAENFVQVFSQ